MIGILAHGVGSRGTLPLPLWQFVWASAAALGLSFVSLGALWKTPKLESASSAELPRSAVVVKVCRVVAEVLAFALFLLTGAAALFGADVGGDSVNLAPVTIFVIVWVGVAVAASIVGDFWKVINPYRMIGRFFPETTAHAAPAHHWFAAATIFGFLVVELVHPNGDSPRILGYSMLVYSAIMVAGMARSGRVWLDRADGFEVLFSLLGAMSPLHLSPKGNLAFRKPLSGLAEVDVLPGTAILILTVLGGTSFDGFSESSLFTDIVGRPTGWAAAPAKLIGLAIFVAIATILYWFGAKAIARVTGTDHAAAADLFAASLVPIVWGYAIAHYAQLLVDQVQSFWFRLSNPFGRFDDAGAPTTDWFGAASGEIDFNIVNVDAVAWIQALSIVIGHVAGVIFAHEIAVKNYNPKMASRSQQTMLFVMVLYSVVGLWLLFAG